MYYVHMYNDIYCIVLIHILHQVTGTMRVSQPEIETNITIIQCITIYNTT